MKDYLLTDWIEDVETLLSKWAVTDSVESLFRDVDSLLERKYPDNADAEQRAERLIVAISFLWHRRKDSDVDRFFVAGSSASIAHPKIIRALHRVVMAIPSNNLNRPIDSDFVLRCAAEE